MVVILMTVKGTTYCTIWREDIGGGVNIRG